MMRRAEEAQGGEEEGDDNKDKDGEDNIKAEEEDGRDGNEGVGPAKPARRCN